MSSDWPDVPPAGSVPDAQFDDAHDEPQRRPTWRPVDLTAVLDGTYRPPEPTVGARADGVGLFYLGRVHSVASESEAGKTWLALYACLTELNKGNHVVYLDFEDDENGVVGRLLALGGRPEDIRQRFHYIRPDEAITALGNREDLAEVLADTKPTLAVLDGVTEAMTMHGLDGMKNNHDIATFGKLLPRWIADRGPASVNLDHVTKDKEGRGKYAIGGVHKLNGINGAAYILENRQPFGAGVTGRSGVYIAKDRPAQLRMHALPAREGLHWFADLVVKSHDITFAEPCLYPPRPKEDTGLRPVRVMAKVSRILGDNSDGLSKNAIETMAGGNRGTVRTALELLVSEGYVSVVQRGAAKVHVSDKPFTAPEEGDE